MALVRGLRHAYGIGLMGVALLAIQAGDYVIAALYVAIAAYLGDEL